MTESSTTREQERSRRKREVRAQTISLKRMPLRERIAARLLHEEIEAEIGDVERPRTRGDCLGAERPCPFVSCKHHLYLDVSVRTGAIKLNFPDLEVWEMNETCALDVADRGGTTLEEVGAIMNVTRERIRQVEVSAEAKVRDQARALFAEYDAPRDVSGSAPLTEVAQPALGGVDEALDLLTPVHVEVPWR